MPSKTATKSKTKPAQMKKPAPKPAHKPATQKSAPAKAPAKPAAAPAPSAKAAAKPAAAPKPGTGKAPVSNVEAIKALAIKAGAAKGGAAQLAVTPADKDGEISDSPLLDLSDAAVRKMIKNAKKRGYVTYEQLNGVLPSEEVTSEKIEDVLAMLNEMGINVVESEEAGEDEEKEDDDDDDDAGGDLVETSTKSVAETKKSEPGERTDDPVRMYLREMGSVELLSREGEIAIAKRIEAGREAMIAGLCESPLTFQAIIIWRDELNEGKVFLRDIIDLEATYAGPDAVKGMANPGVPGQPGVPGAPAPALPVRDGCARDGRSSPVRAACRHPVPRGAAASAATAMARPQAPRKARPRRSAKATSTTTTWRIPCRSPRSRPSSSRR